MDEFKYSYFAYCKNQTVATLQYQLILPNGELSDLEFLIIDYFDHFYYHLNQINPEWI